MNRSAPYMSGKFVKENFAFRRTLTGVKEQQPRWKRCVLATDQMLGEALGKSMWTSTSVHPRKRVSSKW